MGKIEIALIFPDVGIDFGRTKVIYNICRYLSNEKTDFKVFLITNKGNNLTEFNKLNITIKFLPISVENRNIFNFLVSLIYLFFIVIKYKIKIVHSHHRYSDFIVYLVSLITKIRTISTVHSFLTGFYKMSFLSDKIIAVSKDVETYLNNEFNVDKGKLSVIYNGVEKHEEIKNIKPFNNTKFRIICVGRFDYEKGQDILIEALEIIWQQKIEIELVLVGAFLDYSIKYTHDENQKVKQEFKNKFENLLKINSEKISIIRSNETPWEEMLKSDLVIIPSRLESFGLVAIESGIVSKCVIASNTGGLKEIIDNSKNGVLFDPENVKELNEKILYFYNNREYLRIYGNALNKTIQEKFTLEKMMEKYISLYKQLL